MRGGANAGDQPWLGWQHHIRNNYIPDFPHNNIGRTAVNTLLAPVHLYNWATAETPQQQIDRFVNEGRRVLVHDNNGNWVNTGHIIDQNERENIFATRIQALQRGRRIRSQRNNSAMAIQSVFRGMTGRKTGKVKRFENKS